MKIDLSKEYQTRDGRPVRLLCDDAPGPYPVVGLVGEPAWRWTRDGLSEVFSDQDLIEVQPLAKRRRQMKTDLSKEYETEDGCQVVLLTDSAPGNYPFVGYRTNTICTSVIPEAWTESGEAQNRRGANLKPKQTLAEKLQPQIPWEWLRDDIVCVAMDEDQSWYAYTKAPSIGINGGIWRCGMTKYWGMGEIKMPTVPAERWKETLVFRPEGE